MTGRRAPENEQFVLVFDESRDCFVATLLIITANGLDVKGYRALLAEFGQSGKQGLMILHLAHAALVIVHAFPVRFRIPGQERPDDLQHVPEFLEGQPQTVNTGGMGRIHLTLRLQRARVEAVHGLQHAIGIGLFARLLLQRGMDLAHALVQIRGFVSLNPLSGRAQKARFALLQMQFKWLELRQLVQILGDLHHYHLQIAQVVQVIQLILQKPTHFLDAGMRRQGPRQIENRQQPPGGHAQVMHRLLGKVVTADFEPLAVFPPALLQRGRQHVPVLFSRHFLSTISRRTPNISSNSDLRLFRAHFSSIKSPLPRRSNSQLFFFRTSVTPVTR